MQTGPEAAVAVLVEWEGITAEQYDEMINRMSVADVSLPGGLFHVAGLIENGWRIFDVWESPEVLERFTREILMPILEVTGFPPPQVWTWPVYNTLSPPTEEVRASRLRIIAMQNAERRKLARDLHDGAQQNLIALKIKLGLAATLAGQDPAKLRTCCMSSPPTPIEPSTRCGSWHAASIPPFWWTEDWLQRSMRKPASPPPPWRSMLPREADTLR